VKRFRISWLFVLAAALSFAAAVAAAPLPPLPGNPALGPQAPAAAGSPEAGAEHLTRGVVTIEREGRLIGVGTVLSGDGRILTALSALGASDFADVRYADGNAAHAKVGHRDKEWDLALLVPLSGRWTEGLRASELDPTTAELRALVATRPGRAALVPAHLRGAIDARAREGADALPGALDVELKGGVAIGAPVTDPQGGVVGVLIRACRPGDGGACSPITVAAPIAPIRLFLSRTPLNAVAPSPWLGIVGAPDTSGSSKGVRVMAIAPQSPAQKSGLKTSTDRAQADLIVAVDGQPVDTPEKLAEAISKHAVGETVKLLVLSAERFHEVSVTLRAAP
jgi:serine protease Do